MHSSGLHFIDSELGLNRVQFLPPYLGLGLVQLRERVFMHSSVQ